MMLLNSFGYLNFGYLNFGNENGPTLILAAVVKTKLIWPVSFRMSHP